MAKKRRTNKPKPKSKPSSTPVSIKPALSEVKKPAKRKVAKKASPRKLEKPRTRLQEHRAKVIEARKKKIPSSINIFTKGLIVLRDNWVTFAIIGAIYAVIDLILVHGLSSANITSLENQAHTIHGLINGLGTGLSLFTYLVGSAGSTSTTYGPVYQGILVIVFSLALVWCLRHAYARSPITVLDGFYKGMYPLVVTFLVFIVIGIQTVPLIIGGTIFADVVGPSSVAINNFQRVGSLILCVLIAIPTFYFICSSIFALYISTLPGMTPIRALRSARKLAKHRRLIIIRKLIFIPVALAVLALVIMVPILFLLTPISAWAFFFLSVVGLILFHTYMYGLYRELL